MKKNVKQDLGMKIHTLRLRFDFILNWAKSHNYVIHDYLEEEYRRLRNRGLHEDEYCDFFEGFLNKAETHLVIAKSLGLNDLATFFLDAIWDSAPHVFLERDVKCAKEIADDIKNIEIYNCKTAEGYIKKVIAIVDEKTQKHDIFFDSKKWNTSFEFIREWAYNEYANYNKDKNQ